MGSRNRIGAVSLALAVLAVVAPAPAMAGRCENVCRPSTSCDLACRDFWGEWITCGEYGVCGEGGPSCTPNWQTVGTEGAGFVHYNDYSINQCNTFAMTRINQRDVSACDPNNLERHYCQSQLVQAAFGCCWFGCTPQIRDESNCN
jgi:hypothetical protein